MADLISDRRYEVFAYTQGARWVLIGGLSSRRAAEEALTALIARDGARAADASGRMVSVTFEIVEAKS